MFKRLVDRDWFFYLEFLCIIVAVLLWNNLPDLSWQPLLVAVFPLLLRIMGGESPFIRTPFEIPIVFFLLTAGMGVWAAYQPTIAWIKFWFIVIAVLMYYLQARQPENNLWSAAILISLISLTIIISYYLYNFNLTSSEQLAVTWKSITGSQKSIKDIIQEISPNNYIDTIDLALPFTIALIIRTWKRRTYFLSLLYTVLSILILITLGVSDLKSAFIAITGLIVVWLLWMATQWLGRRFKLSTSCLSIFSLLVICLLAFGFLIFYIHPNWVEVVIGGNNLSELDQRLHLGFSAVKLIEEFPFTGSGLSSFPGIYSNYILGTPNFIVSYSHNLYLDVSLEQGILGSLMLIWIYLGSCLLLVSTLVSPNLSLLHKAILSSLTIIIIHGLVDTTLYNTMTTPLLFLLPGMAVGFEKSRDPLTKKISLRKNGNNKRWVIIATIFSILLSGLIIFYRPILSAWYANLGAVEMSKIDLSDFPSGQWDEGQRISLLAPAKSRFKKAISYNPENSTAHYRLGLISMMKRDYSSAVNHLETAYKRDPFNRGVIKSLGLSYIWDGLPEKALPLLYQIPESNQEVSVYSWWWGEQGRPDLVMLAKEYLKMAGTGQ